MAAGDAGGSIALVGGDRVQLEGSTGPKTGFPLASFGLQVYNDDTAFQLTTLALEAGYRNFFASVLAGNQRGFAKAVQASPVPRSELYICGTVLSNRARGEQAAYLKTKQGCLENMEVMATGGIDKLDMVRRTIILY
jgi:diketogulonate reductase-like aldo/keto reductase